MKKLLALALPFVLFTSCGGNENKGGSNTNNSINNEDNTVIKNNSSKILVAYFSVTNHTETLAKYASEHLDSDLFEIVPMEEYTSEDIDYETDCRANREQNDQSARPQIKNKIEDISIYDTIVLGYPIWWGQAPKIMYTFIESYDFNGKTILPFCTSGSSSIGSSATNLAKNALGANWLNGSRFADSTSKETINNWLDENIKKEENMELIIDNTKVEVTRENNASINALKEISKDGLTINMHEFGGFEQTGKIGQSIVRNDSQMDVVPGDIVLYQGDQISVFYAKSSWSYTRLGHINLNESKLNELLNKDEVTFTLRG